jgi:hypothetical protein
MVNNSTNINKIDNRLSLSPQTIAHNKDHIFDMKLEIQVLARGWPKNVVGLNRLIGSQPSPS